MNSTKHTMETLKLAGLIVVLASLLFAITAWAQTPATESTTPGVSETDTSAAEQAADPSATGSREKSWWQKRQAQRKARAEIYRQRLAAQIQPALQSQAPAQLREIRVAFKLDPRLTRSLYMGERWVLNSSGVQEGKYTAEARIQGLDVNGRSVEISPKWIPSDSEMVTVSRGQGKAFVITVHRAGESSLSLTSQGVSKTLAIKATAPKENVLQVEISQKG